MGRKVRMERKITVGISNRHVHLTEETYNMLFKNPLTKKKDLNQVGEFASNEMVTIKTDKGEIENVRIVGPLRKYNQVEISKSDAHSLGLNPPVRRSGDLKNSETITIESEQGEVTLTEACILAERHVHMNEELARNLNVSDGQQVKILVNGSKACILFAKIKISENGFFELHLDTDDANAACLENGSEVTLIL